MAFLFKRVTNRSRVFTVSQRCISQSQAAHFKKHGWVAVQNFFSEDETKALRGALTSLATGGILANVSTVGDGKTYTEVPRSLQTCPLSPHHKLFKMLPFHPKVGNAIHTLLCDSNEDESAVCYLSQTFWKPAKAGAGTGWHQDNAYFLVDRYFKGCGMWIPVHDSYIENGTFRLCDTKTEILTHVRDGTSDHHITCSDSLTSDDIPIDIELKAGGAIFFDFNTPHRTNSNTTEHPRAAVAYHFLNCKDYIFRQFPLPEDAEWITPVVCGPENTFGEKEYGEKVWSEEEFATEVENIKSVCTQNTTVSFKTVKQDLKYD